MPPIPASASLPRYEEFITSEKGIHTAYPATSSPSIHQPSHQLPPSSSKECQHLQSHSGGCSNIDGGHCGHHHKVSRIRRFLVPILLGIVSLGSLIIVGWAGSVVGYYLPAWGHSEPLISQSGSNGGAEGFARRAVEAMYQAADPGNGQNGGGVFIERKYYLIIIFVGLFIVLILGIMLSAWCCKGAFQNPLCCPCYLCACCGGLACLECIGCGLCAEGFEQVATDGY